MKQFVYYTFILFFIACSNKRAEKSMDVNAETTEELSVEKEDAISEVEAYTFLVKQKLQEHIDKKLLVLKHPEFATDHPEPNLFTIHHNTQIEDITFIGNPKTVLDSMAQYITKVDFKNAPSDTIISNINMSTTTINNEVVKTSKIVFEKIEKPQKTIVPKVITKKPTKVEKFSLKDLSFTWEEINSCDCLFVVNVKQTEYRKLYFGRFEDNTKGILQLGKLTEQQLIPVTKPRNKNRINGKAWKETYQNKKYRIQLNATPTKSKIKRKYTYFVDFKYTDLQSKKTIRNTVIVNCNS